MTAEMAHALIGVVGRDKAQEVLTQATKIMELVRTEQQHEALFKAIAADIEILKLTVREYSDDWDADAPKEPDAEWVRGECPMCGDKLVSNMYYEGGKGYLVYHECWSSLGTSPSCIFRRIA